MNRYTIYCTEEQTKKALELGAPIEKVCHSLAEEWKNEIPAAEQMIGWLESTSSIDEIDVSRGCSLWYFDIWQGCDNIVAGSDFKNRKAATLAAIDAALDYLSKNAKPQ